MLKNPRVALYLRVSTRDQNFSSQERALLDYCKRRGWKAPRVFQEKASGSRDGREVLHEVMTAARSGQLDVIAVYKLDRWGRSLLHSMQTIKELGQRGVGFVSITEAIDTTEGSPMAQFLIGFISLLAEWNGDQIRERVNAGMAAAKRRGVRIGRPRGKQAQIEKALKLLESGKVSGREIARKTGLSASYVSMLSNGKRSAGK